MFRSRPKEGKEHFSVNGAAVLERIIQSFNGNCNPIRSYSAEELEIATNRYHSEIHSDYNYILYQGIHQNREIVVKKIFPRPAGTDALELAATEIATASRMSSHGNVLKLLGCCLETELPILVYEFPENGNLGNNWLFHRQSQDQDHRLSWDQKLKIVIKIANSIAYLNYGLPNTFVHRDIKSTNIFLDRNLSPKLFDFKLALMIPKGETHVEACVEGTFLYVDPLALHSGRYTEKSDVYCFGVLLCEVLTEKRISQFFHYSKSNQHPRNVIALMRDQVEQVCKDYWEEENIRVKVLEYINIAERCLKSNAEDRPNMIEAEKQLRQIKTL